MFVGILLHSLTERHPGCSEGSFWGKGTEPSNYESNTSHTAAGFLFVFVG